MEIRRLRVNTKFSLSGSCMLLVEGNNPISLKTHKPNVAYYDIYGNTINIEKPIKERIIVIVDTKRKFTYTEDRV
jgi:hypothetical protein